MSSFNKYSDGPMLVAHEQGDEFVALSAPSIPDVSLLSPTIPSLPDFKNMMAGQIRKAVGMANVMEMAAMLQVSKQTLATWRTKKRGPPYVKIGKKVFYLLSDFSTWVIEECERQAKLSRANATSHKRRDQRQHNGRDHTEEAECHTVA